MAHLKLIKASRGHIHEYENTKRKLYNCNANIYFKRQCLQKITSCVVTYKNTYSFSYFVLLFQNFSRLHFLDSPPPCKSVIRLQHLVWLPVPIISIRPHPYLHLYHFPHNFHSYIPNIRKQIVPKRRYHSTKVHSTSKKTNLGRIQLH
jgi:hypothetical protein